MDRNKTPYVVTDLENKRRIVKFSDFKKELPFLKDNGETNILLLEVDPYCSMHCYSLNDNMFFLGNSWDYHLGYKVFKCRSIEEVSKFMINACRFWNIPLTVEEKEFNYEERESEWSSHDEDDENHDD